MSCVHAATKKHIQRRGDKSKVYISLPHDGRLRPPVLRSSGPRQRDARPPAPLCLGGRCRAPAGDVSAALGGALHSRGRSGVPHARNIGRDAPPTRPARHQGAGRAHQSRHNRLRRPGLCNAAGRISKGRAVATNSMASAHAGCSKKAPASSTSDVEPSGRKTSTTRAVTRRPRRRRGARRWQAGPRRVPWTAGRAVGAEKAVI